MNHYGFNEITIGLQEEFEVEITDRKMQMFAEISGDYNPMHTDEDYSIKRGYLGKIVYGMLASSFYSTLVGMYLPGEKCLLNKCDVDYWKPVYLGNVLKVSGEVVDKRYATRRITIKGKMINQEGIMVNTAKIVVSFTGD